MMRSSCSFERDASSDRTGGVLSDDAFKDKASAPGVRVGQTHDCRGGYNLPALYPTLQEQPLLNGHDLPGDC